MFLALHVRSFQLLMHMAAHLKLLPILELVLRTQPPSSDIHFFPSLKPENHLWLFPLLQFHNQLITLYLPLEVLWNPYLSFVIILPSNARPHHLIPDTPLCLEQEQPRATVCTATRPTFPDSPLPQPWKPPELSQNSFSFWCLPHSGPSSLNFLFQPRSLTHWIYFMWSHSYSHTEYYLIGMTSLHPSSRSDITQNPSFSLRFYES